MYHFPTREALLLAIIEHAAQRLETAMLAHLAQRGLTFGTATAAQRLAAYADVVGSERASRAEYAAFYESAYWPELAAAWEQRMAPWFQLSSDLAPELRARLSLVRMAVDGLWFAEATDMLAPAPADRDGLLALIADLLAEPVPAGPMPAARRADRRSRPGARR